MFQIFTHFSPGVQQEAGPEDNVGCLEDGVLEGAESSAGVVGGIDICHKHGMLTKEGANPEVLLGLKYAEGVEVCVTNCYSNNQYIQ